MLLQRFYHEGLAQASYLIGCQRTGEGLVVDANRDVGAYIDAAAENGFRIAHVTETHIHADYLSGSRELARRTGARLYLSAEGGSEWQYAFAEAAGARLLRDGDHLTVGMVRIDVVHTPGHTPEHLTFVITDTVSANRPLGALTGDFIFVGDVGRPDLLERAASIEGTMRASAAQLFQSLQRFVTRYPDYLQLWPGHGSGSACGKALGAVPQSTLGYEKLANWALQISDEETFIDAVLDGQPDPPTYFARMKSMNRAGLPLALDPFDPPRLGGEALPRLLESGALVIDLRRPAEVARGHVPGTVNIPLTRSFVTWAGWLVPADQDVYLLDESADDETALRARRELAMIGIDRVAGSFGRDAFDSWTAGGKELARVDQIHPEALATSLALGDVTVIDVRNESEWEEGHIAGAIHAPLGRLVARLGSIPADAPIVVQCEGGTRSSIAASLLLARGVRASNLAGGLTAWRKADLPLAVASLPSPAR